MVCIDCHLHGKKVHLLQQGTKDEYVFVTPKPQVFPDDCESCLDPLCPYNFNTKKLMMFNWLREKILGYVFDATFDDMLLEMGLTAARSTPMIYELDDDTEIYSKPRYSKKQGKKLLDLDEAAMQKREQFFKAVDKYHSAKDKMRHAPPKIIIERKDNKHGTARSDTKKT